MNKIAGAINSWKGVVTVFVSIVVFIATINFRVIALEKICETAKPEIRANADAIISIKEKIDALRKDSQETRREQKTQYKDMSKEIQGIRKEQAAQYTQLILAINSISK